MISSNDVLFGTLSAITLGAAIEGVRAIWVINKANRASEEAADRRTTAPSPSWGPAARTSSHATTGTSYSRSPSRIDYTPFGGPSRHRPDELVALMPAVRRVFELLRTAFDVPDVYLLDLAQVDSAEPPDIEKVAALTLQRLQALLWMASSETPVRLDRVVGLVAELNRNLDELGRDLRDRDEESRADFLSNFANRLSDAAIAARRRSASDDEAGGWSLW